MPLTGAYQTEALYATHIKDLPTNITLRSK
jgi:hypothetical protein